MTIGAGWEQELQDWKRGGRESGAGREAGTHRGPCAGHKEDRVAPGGAGGADLATDTMLLIPGQRVLLH